MGAVDESRRNFLKGVAVSAGAAVVNKLTPDQVESKESTYKPWTPIELPPLDYPEEYDAEYVKGSIGVTTLNMDGPFDLFIYRPVMLSHVHQYFSGLWADADKMIYPSPMWRHTPQIFEFDPKVVDICGDTIENLRQGGLVYRDKKWLSIVRVNQSAGLMRINGKPYTNGSLLPVDEVMGYRYEAKTFEEGKWEDVNPLHWLGVGPNDHIHAAVYITVV